MSTDSNMTGVLVRGTFAHRDAEREDDVKTQKTSSTSQFMPDDTRSEERDTNRFFLRALRTNPACSYLDLRKPASGTARQYISVI